MMRINPLPNLRRRQRIHSMLLFVKVQHRRVPRYARRLDDFRCNILEIGHHILVPNVRHPAGKDLVPVFHRISIAVIQLRQTCKFGCVIQPARRKVVLERREYGVHRLPRHVQYQCIRKEQMEEPNVDVVGEHLIRKSQGIRPLLALVVVLVVHIRIDHLPPRLHIRHDVIRQLLHLPIQHPRIPHHARFHDFIPNRVQPTVEHRVLSRPDDRGMSVQYPFQEGGSRTYEPNDENGRASLRPNVPREETGREDRFHAGHLFYFVRSVEWRDRGQFVLVPFCQVIPRRRSVLRLDIVIGEHGVMHPLQSIGIMFDYPRPALIGNCIPIRRQLKRQFPLQQVHQKIPPSLDGILLGSNDLRETRYRIDEYPIYIPLQHMPVILPGLFVLAENEKRLGAIRQCVEIIAIVTQTLLVTLHGAFEHIGHEVHLAQRRVGRAQHALDRFGFVIEE
mmetsp:Transcript_26054/g.54364  ORF Transcript_26054/g.54364 Transcript_26054/m.54364 type:complete len:449 (-) Transcript_26054:699-2045(-)